MNICPHCQQDDCVPHYVIILVEIHGDAEQWIAKCKHCSKPIVVDASRVVVINNVSPQKPK